jgi:hypothetical protein
MPLQTYPETPEQEAARINSASGDPEGITAQQVANNRALNQSLTSFATGGFAGSGAGSNPFSQLVTQLSTSISQATNQGIAALPTDTSVLSKAKLDSVIDQYGGGLTSGYNQFSQLTGEITSGLGGIADTVQTTFSGAVSTLQSAAGSLSNISADVASSINKLTGGSLAGGLSDLAVGISGAAGSLNNILSLFRGSNIPQGAELFVRQGTPIKVLPRAENDWRVRILGPFDLFGTNTLFDKLKATNGVVWPFTPNVTVSTKAEYTGTNPIHGNYTFHSYKSSMIDDIQISGDFICETEDEAAYWIAATTFFKTATKMFFGESAYAGNPPIICRLSGYGSSIFNEVPVIIKSFSVDLKDDVNYIKCNTFGTNTWVPILSTISVTVAPIYNRENLRKFKIEDYARGKMVGTNGVGYI